MKSVASRQGGHWPLALQLARQCRTLDAAAAVALLVPWTCSGDSTRKNGVFYQLWLVISHVSPAKKGLHQCI